MWSGQATSTCCVLPVLVLRVHRSSIGVERTRPPALGPGAISISAHSSCSHPHRTMCECQQLALNPSLILGCHPRPFSPGQSVASREDRFAASRPPICPSHDWPAKDEALLRRSGLDLPGFSHCVMGNQIPCRVMHEGWAQMERTR